MASERTERAGGIIVLGTSLLALGALLWAWSEPAAKPAAPAEIDLRVEPPSGPLLFNASGLVLAPENATALGALLYAAALGNFTVDVSYHQHGAAFVEAVAGFRNQGVCGWVYAVDGVKPSVSSDRSLLRSGHELRWFWDCAG